MDTKYGICLECGNPLDNPASFGYHISCADIAHKKANDEADKNFPFVVVGFDGVEIDRFKTKKQADYYLYNIQHSKIEHRLT